MTLIYRMAETPVVVRFYYSGSCGRNELLAEFFEFTGAEAIAVHDDLQGQHGTNKEK